ncbi:MAG TPA: hypothetical protein VF752_13065 [Thermoleophilaceae bacterium]
MKLLGAVGAVAALLVVATVLLLGGGDVKRDPASAGKTIVDKSHRFALSYPASGWNAVPASGLAKVPSRPAAVLQRADRRATVVVRSRAALNSGLVQIARGLTPELKRRFSDFHPLSARIVRLAGGPALAYMFAGTRTGTVQTELVAPAQGRSFTVEAVARGNDPRVAREVGAILRSFVAR